jgi:hypothetical protein
MRKIHTAVVASIAALAVVGTAVAASHDNHVMKLDLPDGSIARIEYKGDVAPKVIVAPALSFVRCTGSIRSQQRPSPCSTASRPTWTDRPT